jgi:acetylornithine deacetylase/succinyl-diaminopimelate desuccinylase-like protein
VGGGPTTGRARALDWARRHGGGFVGHLEELVAIPSVSAQPRHTADVAAAAEWLGGHMRSIGLERVEVVPTRRHPIVYADWVHAEGRPTVLVYGHYDVQPPDPVGEWRTPPFRPSIQGEDLVGRGASDDKGQLFVHLKAIESWLQAVGRMPVNVRVVLDGEEEVGSPNLRLFLQRRRHELAPDVAVLSDTRMLGPDRPALTYALRGSLSLEVSVEGPAHDLHSGGFGGAVEEPLAVLCTMVASLHHGDGRVAVPGFYRCVRRWPQEELEFMGANGPTDGEVLRAASGARPGGERRFTCYERTTIRPAIAVNGISGGYQGPGAKTVIPARASVKLNVRLVPDQDPAEIERLVRRHLARFERPGRRVRVRVLSAAPPVVLDRRHPGTAAAAAAYRAGFGRPPALLRSGGTIPVVRELCRTLRTPVVLMGFALPDDRMHAPNEKLHLPTFHRGVATSIAFLDEVAGRLPARRPPAPRFARFRP